MTGEEPTFLGRTWTITKIVWTVAVIVIATCLGALSGWQTHGWDGAIGGGLIGLILGAILSRSIDIILEFLPG